MYIITVQDTIIDKCLSYCTKFIIKYENYAEKPFVGQFTRVLGIQKHAGVGGCREPTVYAFHSGLAV